VNCPQLAPHLLPLLQVPNISMPLLRLPKPFPLPVAAIPNDASVIKALEAIFPRGKLTSLPAFVTAPIMPLGTPRLPLLSLRNITIPTIEEIAIEIGAAPPKWFNIDLEKMAQQLSNITWKIPTLPGPLQYTLPGSMNFTMPSITIPDINIPQLPQMQLPNLPGLPKPNLTRISAAVSSMPDIAADISQWPKLIDQWKVRAWSSRCSQQTPQDALSTLCVWVAASRGSFHCVSRLRTNGFQREDSQQPINIHLECRTSACCPWLTPTMMTHHDYVLYCAACSAVSPQSKHLSRPFDFDLSAFTKLVTSNEQIARDSVEISFEVPNVMAQWIAGIIQKVPLPQLQVQDETQHALKSVLPQLPELPALLVVNISTPYFNADAKQMQDLPTVVVPDSMVSAGGLCCFYC
jgi:hypothetical protein